MAIYYSPYPSQQPSTALTQYVNGDWWINTSLSYAYKYNTLATPKRWTRTTAGTLPPLSAIPAIVATTISATTVATQNQAVNFNAVEAYGGAAKLTSYTSAGTFIGYDVVVSPSLPSGLSITKTFSEATVTNQSGTQQLFNKVVIGITGTPTVGSSAQTYTVTFTDASGLTSSASFSLEVSTSGVSPLVTTSRIASNTFVQSTSVNITPVTATGGTAPYTFSISPSLSGTGLSINSSTGAITGTTSGISTNSYTITVSDSSGTPQTSSKTYGLTITGIPIVTTLAIPTTTLTENISFTPFRPVTATGGFGALSYAISPALPNGLSFTSSNGAITGSATTATPTGNYTVTVSDSNSPPQTGTQRTFSLTVNVLQPVTTTLLESVLSLQVNSPVSTTPVSGSGGYGTLSYAISPSLPAGLSFNTSTGAITGTPSATSSSTSYTVTVTDQATTPQTSSKSFTLSVAAVPLVVTKENATISLFRGVPISLLQATGYKTVATSGGFGTLSYALSGNTLPTGLVFNTSNGAITGTATVTNASNTFTVAVTDQATPTPQTVSNTFILVVSAPDALIVTQNQTGTTNLTQGVATNLDPVDVTGGYGTLTYSVNPTLPNGLTINSGTGVVTGTPTGFNLIANTYTVSVSDQASQTTTNTFSIRINTVAFVKSASVPSQNVTQSVAITAFKPITVSGGATPYSYANTGALPVGLTLSSVTGFVSGTPTTVASNTFTVTATDAAGQQLSQTTTINVEQAPAITTSTDVATKSLVINVDSASFSPVSASGGYGTITFSINPALPTGLTFVTANGYIYGVASQLKANQSYKVTATDSIAQNSNSSFFLEVINPPLRANTVLPSVTIVSGSQVAPFVPVTASGGVAPRTFSATLPTGLFIVSANGAIYGNTSTTQSATPTTITVTDVVGTTTSNTFDLTIDSPAALTVATTPALAAIYGVPFNVIPVQASGGYGANSYSLTLGTLPSGLTFVTSNGAITGTATALSANSNYEVTVTDSSAQSNTGAFTFGVLPPTLIANTQSTPTTLTQYQASTPFIPVSGSGGYGTYSYAITSGSLPAGLTFNTTTGQISGTPTAISSGSITITVTDGASQTATGTFSLTVSGSVPPALSSTLQQSDYILYQTQAVDVTPVTGSGGFGSYQYSITGTLPTGLSFNTTTGKITGTPSSTANANTYTITVNDAVPQYSSQTFTIQVEGPPVSAIDYLARHTANLAYAQANAAFDKANTNTGGTGGGFPYIDLGFITDMDFSMSTFDAGDL